MAFNCPGLARSAATGAPAAKLLGAMIKEYTRGEIDIEIGIQIGNVLSLGAVCSKAVVKINDALYSFLDKTFDKCELTTPTSTPTTSITSTPTSSRTSTLTTSETATQTSKS